MDGWPDPNRNTLATPFDGLSHDGNARGEAVILAWQMTHDPTRSSTLRPNTLSQVSFRSIPSVLFLFLFLTKG